MKKRFRSMVVFALVFTLFSTCFSGLASANEVSKSEEQQVKEIAELLEFIFEEAVTKDANGNVVMDFEMIEEKFGSTPELESVKQEQQMGKILDCKTESLQKAPLSMQVYGDPVDQCVERKVRNGFAEVFSVVALTSIVTSIMDKNYTTAAKKILKVGVKGSIPGIAVQLSYWLMTCVYEEEGWWGK